MQSAAPTACQGDEAAGGHCRRHCYTPYAAWSWIETTAMLDPEWAIWEVMEIISRLNEEKGITVVQVTN